MQAPFLQFRDLATGYPRGGRFREVTKGFSASLLPGEVICLLGKNGTGKSTLLKTLGGVLPPLEGTLLLEGIPLEHISLRERARKIGVVQGTSPRVPWMTVEELVLAGRFPHTPWHGSPSKGDRLRVSEILEQLGLLSLRESMLDSISDGERRRAFLGRALAQETPVLLLDEPLAFIDLPGGAEILHLLGRIAKEEGRGVLFSSHHLEGALGGSDRIWLLSSGGTALEGVGEDLLLSGELERAFLGDVGGSVAFCRERSSFFCPPVFRGKVELEGRGALALRWTRHALERRGWHCVPSGNAPGALKVRVEEDVAGRGCWTCFWGKQRRECCSLEEVLREAEKRGE